MNNLYYWLSITGDRKALMFLSALLEFRYFPRLVDYRGTFDSPQSWAYLVEPLPRNKENFTLLRELEKSNMCPKLEFPDLYPCNKTTLHIKYRTKWYPF
jgi:hypothetical protein